jgi:hypothetical protein
MHALLRATAKQYTTRNIQYLHSNVMANNIIIIINMLMPAYQ